MARFLAVSNRKGGVGKSTIAVMMAHAAAAWGNQRVLLMDLDTQCNASLMLIGGEGFDRATRGGYTIANYFFDRFDEVADDESTYVINTVGDVAHPMTRNGRVSLLTGSKQLEDIQSELFLRQSKKDLDADAVAVHVRGRMRRMMKHFGMDFDLVIMDCPPGLSFAALAALDLADRVLVPFRPDFVSQHALDQVAQLIERLESRDELEDLPFAERRYSCLANTVTSAGQERILLDEIALDHPLLKTRLPQLDAVARSFDWDERKKSMEDKYKDALPYLKALYDEVFSVPQLMPEMEPAA